METQNVNSPSNVKVSESQGQNSQAGSVGEAQPIEAPKQRSIAGLYITPVLQFDSQALSVIFQVRDGLSGEVKQEYPQESVIKGREESTNVREKTTNVDETPAVNVDANIQPVDTNKSMVPQEKVTQQSASVDLNTAPAESNGATAIASTTVGIGAGLGSA